MKDNLQIFQIEISLSQEQKVIFPSFLVFKKPEEGQDVERHKRPSLPT
jgi:hypothetical protein